MNTLAARLRRPSSLITLAALLVPLIVWGVLLARTAGPRTLDQRAYDIANQIQCPACNGESVANSSSPVAQDMRAVIHQDLVKGMSDQQILDYFRDRYSDAILESPPADGFTLLLWIGPFFLFLAGCWMVFAQVRELRRRAVPALAVAPQAARALPESTSDDPLLDQLRREIAEEEGLAPIEGRRAR